MKNPNAKNNKYSKRLQRALQVAGSGSLVALATRGGGQNLVPRGLGPVIPDGTVVRLPFAYTTLLFSHNTTAYTVGNIINLRVNNAYEPISGTHQPYGWDQMAALYRRYKVIGFSYKISAFVPLTEPLFLLTRSVPVNENATMLDTALNVCAERPATVVRPLAATGGPPIVHQQTVNIPQLLGVTKEQYLADTTRFSADVTTTPEFAYVQLGAAGPSSAAYVTVLIEAVYTVQYWQRVTLGQS